MFAAERVTLETDALGRLMHVPKLPANSRVEAIFLLLESDKSSASVAASTPRRKPHPALAGQVEVMGDIVSTVASEQWNLPT